MHNKVLVIAHDNKNMKKNLQCMHKKYLTILYSTFGQDFFDIQHISGVGCSTCQTAGRGHFAEIKFRKVKYISF